MTEQTAPVEQTEEELRADADAVLNAEYQSHGIDYCVTLSGIDRKCLRSRVQKLKLKLNQEGRDYVNRTKHKNKPSRKYNRLPPVGMTAADHPLSNLEMVALGIPVK